MEKTVSIKKSKIREFITNFKTLISINKDRVQNTTTQGCFDSEDKKFNSKTENKKEDNIDKTSKILERLRNTSEEEEEENNIAKTPNESKILE